MNNDAASIFIRDFDVPVVIGISQNERKFPQTVRLDLDVTFRFSQGRHPTHTDRVTDTLDYEAVVSRILSLSQSHSPALLERFGELIAAMLFDEFGQIESLRISLQKIPPPMTDGVLRAVGVTLNYSKKGTVR
jgi:dihydroneopterin aldolase